MFRWSLVLYISTKERLFFMNRVENKYYSKNSIRFVYLSRKNRFYYKKSSRVGITVYSYGDYIIVKSDNSVSVSR